MRIELEIPDTCAMFHYVLCLIDQEEKKISSVGGHFCPNDGDGYEICVFEGNADG